MIKVEHLKKNYGDVTALVDVSFQLDRGEVVALLGGNGSGKSTSINILTGLLKHDSGHVSIQGIDPFKDPIKARQNLGVFPDKMGLFPHLTVREHLEFFGGIQGLQGEALNEAIATTIEKLNMEDIADRRTKGFSHGQSVKVALGRAIIHDPDYLILDEPTRGLDVYAVRQLRKMLLALKEQGTGILFSSHVMQEVEILSDRIAVIADGKICAEGSKEQLKTLAKTDVLEDAFMTLVSGEQP